YLNEDATPVFTLTAVGTADGSGYWRFGDGWGDQNVDTQYDWVTWDYSGTYTPSESALPTELQGETPVGDWIVYNADVDPTAFDPAFSESNGAGTFAYSTISDPDDASNNLLSIKTDPTADKDNIQFKQATEADAVTVVLKARTIDSDNKGLLFDMDFRSTTSTRFAIKVLNDGTYDIDKGGDGIVADKGDWGFDATEWNTFRFTKNGAEVNIYLNEDATPVFTLTAAGTADGSGYWRFGDGWGDQNVDTQYDWVTWDYSGAYAPAQTRLPDDLVKPPVGDWTVYNADVDPAAFDPAFSESNGAGTFAYSTISDPDDASNNLLSIKTDPTADKDNIQFKQATEADAVTVVLKAKTVDLDNKGLLFDIDFRSTASARFAIKVLNDGTYDIDKGGDGVVADKGDWGFDATEWNMFRVTKAAGVVNIYLNEESTPIFSLTTPDGVDGSGYWRFGDGWGDQNVDTQYDWVTWDYSGAYAPDQSRLPDELTGTGEASTPTLKTIGSPDPLFQDIGFGPDFTTNSYVVSGKDLTADITVTPPTNFEVSIDESVWFTTDNPLVLTQSSGAVDLTTVFVRLNASAEGDYSGDIINATEGGEPVTVAVSGSAVAQVPELSLIAELNDFSQNVSNPSAAQTYRVSGVNLKGAITVTATDNFEVSTDEGTTWAATATVTPEVRTITNATVYVRLNASALGTYSGNIVHTATDATEVTLAVSGEVIPDPGITVMGDFTAFANSIGTASESQSYTIAGTNLASDIVISLPDGFEISFNDELWLPSLSLEPLEGNVEEITLFIRLNGAAEGTYSGDVVHASDGVDAVSKAITGTTDANVLATASVLPSLNVWPNPSSNYIVIERGDWSDAGQVTLYNLSGSRVSEYLVKTGTAKMELDIRALPQGVYLIEYVSNNNTIKMKFIKE
ncbi:MAG: T9SS type A sorting domain-containing protein, partial [Cyclobacteriaceae bacterium]